MEPNHYKKLGRFLKDVYKDLDAEAIKMGVLPSSQEYLDIQAKLRDKALSKWGYSLAEYETAKNEESERRKKKEKL